MAGGGWCGGGGGGGNGGGGVGSLRNAVNISWGTRNIVRVYLFL